MATLYYRPFQDVTQMPSTDAVERILPDYKYIFYDPSRERDPEQQDQKRLEKPKPETLEETHMTLIDHQAKELENYRKAVNRMGHDILSMRQHIEELEDENAGLKRQLNRYDEIRSHLLDNSEVDTLDKKEIVLRYMTLKQRLQTQSVQLTEYKEKVQLLQKELVKKKADEELNSEMRQAHLSQSQIIRQLQEKAGKAVKLEEACRTQEKVIERMEKLLQRRESVKEGSKPPEKNDILADESNRLRNELQQLKSAGLTEGDRLKLYEQLERAENRVAALAEQLEQNSRQWGKERSELLRHLKEANLGLSRPASTAQPGYLEAPSRALKSLDSDYDLFPRLKPLHR